MMRRIKNAIISNKVLLERIAEIQEKQNRRCSFPFWGDWKNWTNWGNWTNLKRWSNWSNSPR